MLANMETSTIIVEGMKAHSWFIWRGVYTAPYYVLQREDIPL
jgi:hypothetical protein